ncbi:tyrosine-type recombinase/integrase [Nautilia sp.]
MIENPKVSLFNRRGRLYVQYYINGRCVQKSLKRDYTKENVKLAKKYVIPEIERKILLGEIQDSKFKAKEFKYYAELYLKQKESLKTWKEFNNMVSNQLIPVFGSYQINKISKGFIKQWIDERLKEVSPVRMQKLLGILKAIFEIAIDYEHIKENPCDRIKLPKHNPIRQMYPFSKEEVTLILNNADGWFQNYLAIAFMTGMRPGEIIALTIEDIDLKNKIINVNKRIKKGEIDTPKTKHSIRKVPIMDELIPYLKNQIETQKQKGLDLLFTTINNRMYYDSDKFHPFWYRLLDKCGIERRVMYNTRHTFALNAIRAGINILDVSQILGHKDSYETLSTYAKYIKNEHLKIKRNIKLY